MSHQTGLIATLDSKAALKIEAVLSSFEGYPLPQWIRTINADEYMIEWWSVQSYDNEFDKKYLLFTYHKLQHTLECYYDIMT
jgi:hypothetical protein